MYQKSLNVINTPLMDVITKFYYTFRDVINTYGPMVTYAALQTFKSSKIWLITSKNYKIQVLV